MLLYLWVGNAFVCPNWDPNDMSQSGCTEVKCVRFIAHKFLVNLDHSKSFLAGLSSLASHEYVRRGFLPDIRIGYCHLFDGLYSIR